VLEIKSRTEILWHTPLADNFSSIDQIPLSATTRFPEHPQILIVDEIEVQNRARKWIPLGVRTKFSSAVYGTLPSHRRRRRVGSWIITILGAGSQRVKGSNNSMGTFGMYALQQWAWRQATLDGK